jgi:hypothetical protein
VNGKLYIHEFVDIIRQNRARSEATQQAQHLCSAEERGGTETFDRAKDRRLT